MDPQLLELICEGIAIGVCPIADDDDLRELLEVLEEIKNEKPPKEPLPFRIPPTDAPRPPEPVVKPPRRRASARR